VCWILLLCECVCGGFCCCVSACVGVCCCVSACVLEFFLCEFMCVVVV